MYWSKASVIDDRKGLLIQKDSLAMIIIAWMFKHEYGKCRGVIYKLRSGNQWACGNDMSCVLLIKKEQKYLEWMEVHFLNVFWKHGEKFILIMR